MGFRVPAPAILVLVGKCEWKMKSRAALEADENVVHLAGDETTVNQSVLDSLLFSSVEVGPYRLLLIRYWFT